MYPISNFVKLKSQVGEYKPLSLRNDNPKKSSIKKTPAPNHQQYFLYSLSIIFMSMPAPYSSRHRRSISSVLPWDRYNSVPPILFAENDDQFQRERRRELQFTLDKLEGRIKVTTEGQFQRVGFEDSASNDVCGLMSMLGDSLANPNKPMVEDDELEDHGVAINWAAKPTELGPGPGDPDCYDHNNESEGVRSMVTGGVAMGSSRNITHPGFSWLSDTEEGWETSSRVSEDSLFDGHTRHPPEPKPGGTRKAFGYLRYSHCLRLPDIIQY